ncbi:MAG: RES family NAD+ phosphorylase [Alphaproteobacteria bacterium]
MRLWRISNHANLSGDGGLYASGRWRTRGRRVVYLADHPASALLETMVHLEIDAEDLPTDYQLLGIDVPDDIAVTTLTGLPNDWREQIDWTRARGNAWLRGNEGALLRVPSAIVPNAENYLLNPAHPDARRITLDSAVRAAFDPRLMAFLES